MAEQTTTVLDAKMAESSQSSTHDLNHEVEKADTHTAKSEHTLQAWLVVLGAGLAFFCTSGFMNAYGVFQEWYAQHQLSDKSAFTISWLGSFATCMMFFGSSIAGFLVDRTGPTILLFGGSIGVLLGTFMTSLCYEYYQFFLAQGLLLGLSMSFLLVPTITTVSWHFEKHRSLATGVAISGSSLGGVIWPIAINRMLNYHGMSFGWTMRIVGFMMIPLLAGAVATVRAPASKIFGAKDANGGKKKTDLSVIKTFPFLVFTAGLFVFYLAMFAPFFFTPTYAVSIGLSTSFAFYLVSVLNAASMFGRILPGLLADRYGNFNMCLVFAGFAGIICFCWTSAKSSGGLVVWCLAYGFASGAMLNLQMTCIAQLAGTENRGAAIGVTMLSTAISGMFGLPIAGELIKYGFLALAMYSGACVVVGSTFILVSRLHQSKRLFVKL